MKLSEEYKHQAAFRNWKPYLEALDIGKGDVILDLGCSIGAVTRMLAQKAGQVTGIDFNPELLEEAKKNTTETNAGYLLMDMASADIEKLPTADGIWSSFTASYFPDFGPVLERWLKKLKPGGWIALTEMSDLFGHEPLDPSIRGIFRKYYGRQRNNNTYDFEMGIRLKAFMTGCGLILAHQEDKEDPELTFRGPAGPEVLQSWDSRFERMTGFRDYLGEKKFGLVREAFLECLSHKDHVSHTTITYLIGRKHL